ncbi:MAG: type III secretion system chaperone [Parachlamydiaceae bacterium]|nr:type III secretion system chaperone [Parachlamydiaceae bacterium]
MLETFIEQLGNELEIQDLIVITEPGHYKIPFEDDIEVEALRNNEGEYAFKAIIGPLPKEKVDFFIARAMEANLFGKGTLGSAIGLDEEAKLLTLSMEVDYNSSYNEWRDKLEDFINSIDFWRKESLNLNVPLKKPR